MFLRNTSNCYFKYDGQHYFISDEIKDMVDLKIMDLFNGTTNKGFDMVLCRNVVIYFTREQQEGLYMRFYDALSPNGYFVMGNTETLFGEATTSFRSLFTRERIYQKIVLC